MAAVRNRVRHGNEAAEVEKPPRADGPVARWVLYNVLLDPPVSLVIAVVDEGWRDGELRPDGKRSPDRDPIGQVSVVQIDVVAAVAGVGDLFASPGGAIRVLFLRKKRCRSTGAEKEAEKGAGRFQSVSFRCLEWDRNKAFPPGCEWLTAKDDGLSGHASRLASANSQTMEAPMAWAKGLAASIEEDARSFRFRLPYVGRTTPIEDSRGAASDRGGEAAEQWNGSRNAQPRDWPRER